MSSHPKRNKTVSLGLWLAVFHFVAFLLSAMLAQMGQGWAGVYVWPVWLLIDFPLSLLHLLMFQGKVDLWVQEMSARSSPLSYFLYAPYFIHGVLGTIWWAFLPKLLFQYRCWQKHR